MGTILTSKQIGWKLRKLRQQAGWTQENLAEKIGVSTQQIQNYESGSNKLNTDRLQQLAQACQPALKNDPPSASKNDPPQVVSFCQNFLF